jgi:hypothetical protein
VKDLGFSLSLNAIEMDKVKRQQSKTERVLTHERQATELAEIRKLLVDLIKKDHERGSNNQSFLSLVLLQVVNTAKSNCGVLIQI